MSTKNVYYYQQLQVKKFRKQILSHLAKKVSWQIWNIDNQGINQILIETWMNIQFAKQILNMQFCKIMFSQYLFLSKLSPHSPSNSLSLSLSLTVSLSIFSTSCLPVCLSVCPPVQKTHNDHFSTSWSLFVILDLFSRFVSVGGELKWTLAILLLSLCNTRPGNPKPNYRNPRNPEFYRGIYCRERPRDTDKQKGFCRTCPGFNERTICPTIGLLVFSSA